MIRARPEKPSQSCQGPAISEARLKEWWKDALGDIPGRKAQAEGNLVRAGEDVLRWLDGYYQADGELAGRMGMDSGEARLAMRIGITIILEKMRKKLDEAPVLSGRIAFRSSSSNLWLLEEKGPALAQGIEGVVRFVEDRRHGRSFSETSSTFLNQITRTKTVEDGTALWSETSMNDGPPLVSRLDSRCSPLAKSIASRGAWGTGKGPLSFLASLARADFFLEIARESLGAKSAWRLSGPPLPEGCALAHEPLGIVGQRPILWVGREDFLPLRLEFRDEKGNLTGWREIEELIIRAEAIAALFQYTPPAGAFQMDAQVLRELMPKEEAKEGQAAQKTLPEYKGKAEDFKPR
jgi:outer membrane lipoprotein-sorting protein